MENSAPRSLILLAVATISAAVNAGLALRMPPSLATFRDMLVGLGVDPPATTKLVLNAPYIWWLLGISALVVFVWVAAKSRPAPDELRRMKIATSTVIILTALAYGFAAYALYTPLLGLSAEV